MVSMRQQLATVEFGSEVAASGAGLVGLARSRRGNARGQAAREEAEREERGARDILAGVLERDVIPLLVRTRRQAAPALPDPVTSTLKLTIGEEQVGALAHLVLTRETPIAAAYVDSLREQGVSAESVYLDVLSPTARRLGNMWELDLCDFAEVTMGLWRLQHVLRGLSQAFLGNAELRQTGPRVLLVPLPGELHTFGLSMVFEFFCRAGWRAWTGPVESNGDLATMVRRNWFSVIGLSTGCDENLETIAARIRTVRRASCNPNLAVMVGGPVFVERPHLSAVVGADATAIDAREAVARAGDLLGATALRR